MALDKHNPWIDESLDGDLFRTTPEDVDLALAMREQFDYDYGVRFRGETIRARGWSVGLFPEEAADNDSLIVSWLDELKLLGESTLLAIPAGTARQEFTGTHDVVELFSPPLVAKAELSRSACSRIRSSLVQMIRGSYYIFPTGASAAWLNNNGKYSLFAGPHDLVERVIGIGVAESWNPVRATHQLDPLVSCRLLSALDAYGLSAHGPER